MARVLSRRKEKKENISEIPPQVIGAFVAFESIEDAAFAITGRNDIKFLEVYINERMKTTKSDFIDVRKMHAFVNQNKERFLNMAVASTATNQNSRHQGTALQLQMRHVSAVSNLELRGKIYEITAAIEPEKDGTV